MRAVSGASPPFASQVTSGKSLNERDRYVSPGVLVHTTGPGFFKETTLNGIYPYPIQLQGIRQQKGAGRGGAWGLRRPQRQGARDPFLPSSSLTPSRQIFHPDSSRRYRSTFSATASLICAASAGSIAPRAARGCGVGARVRRGGGWLWGREAAAPGSGGGASAQAPPHAPGLAQAGRRAPPRPEIGRAGDGRARLGGPGWAVQTCGSASGRGGALRLEPGDGPAGPLAAGSVDFRSERAEA